MGQEQSAALKRLLQPGELLLWEGAPVPGFRLEPAEWFLMPFSLLWCGFACYWEVAALQNGASGVMALFGIPFLLVGLYLVTGRFFHMAWRRKRTYYGVTSMRVILIGPKTTKFLTYRQIPALEKRIRSDGSGTIYLTEPQVVSRSGSNRRTAEGRGALWNIADAERVYRLIETNLLQVEND